MCVHVYVTQYYQGRIKPPKVSLATFQTHSLSSVSPLVPAVKHMKSWYYWGSSIEKWLLPVR